MLNFRTNLFIFSAIVLIGVIYTTPLDDYVNTPDSHYNYVLLKTYDMSGFTVYIFNLTSQKWLDETIVRNPIWWHYLCVSVPDKITRNDAGLLFIDGGSNGNNIPTPTDSMIELTALFAVSTGTIAGVLKQIPNQPTVFVKDPTQKQRSEDAVIAWTWKTFIENPDDPTILLRLPMTKAAHINPLLRAMDSMADFAQQRKLGTLKKFMVAGASKRGWTTWTTAAVDDRVFAAVPIVMDMLSLNTNLHSHYKALGGWTFAFNDYYELNITRYVDSYGIYAMQRVVDPISYLDRYRYKKILAVVTAGDEFFLPDDTHAYWSDLVAATDGSAMLRRLPNAEHSCAGHEISLFFSLRSFFLSTYEKQPLPLVRWSMPNNASHGIIRATVDLSTGLKPFDVKAYYARTLDNSRKDFRLVVGDPKDPNKAIPHPVIWDSTTELTVTQQSNSIIYEIAFIRPFSGWFGFFIQFSFPGLENSVIQITTETNVIPETFPFADCTMDSCYGKLV